MPITRKYPAGSIIYFEGDNSTSIYVLKNGKVYLSYVNDEGEEVTEAVKNGEFFGVKSALARLKREETAQTIEDSLVLVMSQEEFETIAMKNHRLVMKMLKVFSNQLRRLGKKVNKHLEQGESSDPSVELFRIGDYYLRNKRFDNAMYAFSKYIEHFPNGQLVQKAKERITLAQRGISHGFKPIVVTKDGEVKEESIIPESKMAKVPPKSKPDEQEEPLGPEPSEETEDMDLAKEYYDGVNLLSDGDYEAAIDVFNRMKNSGQLESDPEMKEKVEFELGKCFQNLEDYTNAISIFTNLIRNFPKTENMKSILFNLGKCYQDTGDNGKAAGFYKKVVNTPPSESINAKAKKALEAIEAAG